MRKSIFSVSCLSILVILAISSCSSSKHQAEETSFDRIDSLRSHLLTIEDSLLYAWNVMLHDDNERIGDLIRLVDELNYALALDSNLTQSLKTELKTIKKSRYYLSKMTSDQIDIYDSVSFAMSGKIIGITYDFEELTRYPYMEELAQSVHNREAKILRYRVNYDNIAKEHNRFVEEHNNIIQQIDPEYKHTILPLFELMPKDL